ncbi:hypothetical protein EJ02DRAFT_263933 [Clathrospora elynae]|uniref:F-box domain-containing protein n=1 Tax=Clathrospora elynae TaxID=706981 RepID=A0A6A5SEX7_9PLEO|nr:hypothetical protein EJ02DRAFT_263933 [Clathrospora elynae]
MPSRHSDLVLRNAATDNNACFITNLATELVHHIISYIRPASHLDFACTCKHILACSTDILKRHHDAHTKYSVSSDLDPTTVPTLLRSVFGYGDPIPAWHVRSLEIWHDRKSWQDWKMLDFQIPLEQDTISPLTWDFMPGELDDYFDALEFGVGAAYDDRDLARTQLEDGYDGILKAILLAYCPRLRDVKFVTPARDEFVDQVSSLGWLEWLIIKAVDSEKPWMPGFSALRSVAIGVPSETWMSAGHIRAGDNDSLLVQLLRLPNMEHLYFKDLRRQPDDNIAWDSMLPPRCSSVKHLFLDNCDDLGYSLRCALSEAPKALLTASFRAGDAMLEDADNFVSLFGAHQGATLESLMFYDFGERGGIHGYRCHAFRPEELNDFQVLKHICINIQDVELQAYYDRDDAIKDWESDGAFLERSFVNAFPRTTEALILWGTLSDSYMAWEPSDEQGSEDAVVWLVNGDDPEDPDRILKAVYLEDVERRSGRENADGRQEPHRKERVWFRRAIEVGRKRGVDIHTLTNRNKARHNIAFPVAPDKFDLKTRPWGDRPADWVFSPYSGRYEPKGCGRCGECEACLGLYSKKLWESIKREPRRIKHNGKDPKEEKGGDKIEGNVCKQDDDDDDDDDAEKDNDIEEEEEEEEEEVVED